MHTGWLILHLLCVGAWLGCVLTEALFEREMLAQGPAAHRALADLHWRVDRWVELPSFCGVLLSGVVMAHARAPADGWLLAKMAAGLLAVGLNLWCVRLVWRRRAQAQAGDAAGFARTDAAQHRWGAGVLLGLLAALLLAGVRRALLTA
ncbi:MAG: hypothetical protein HY855_21340 [Burkholderiales bacterium]|nr:hypothetical protein [Burkholderiales bacterium]